MHEMCKLNKILYMDDDVQVTQIQRLVKGDSTKQQINASAAKRKKCALLETTVRRKPRNFLSIRKNTQFKSLPAFYVGSRRDFARG